MNTSRELRAERLTTYAIVVRSVGRDGNARYSIGGRQHQKTLVFRCSVPRESAVVRLRGTEVVPRLWLQSPSD